MQAQTAQGWFDLGPSGGFMATAATIGAVAIGAAVIEAALVPGLAIGAAAVIAPRLLRGAQTIAAKRQAAPKRRGATGRPGPAERARPIGALQRLKPGRALAKTITFRVIVASLDFTGNLIILGSLATAAGLSTLSLIIGPVFYFLHETGWNYFAGPAPAAEEGKRIVVLGVALSPALAKTITFRVFATASEFSVNYVVTQDLATAALLSSFGFFIGPFVYYGHERAWEYFWPEERAAPPAMARAIPLLARPASA